MKFRQNFICSTFVLQLSTKVEQWWIWFGFAPGLTWQEIRQKGALSFCFVLLFISQENTEIALVEDCVSDNMDCLSGVFDTILVGNIITNKLSPRVSSNWQFRIQTEPVHGARYGEYAFHGRVQHDGRVALVRKPVCTGEHSNLPHTQLRLYPLPNIPGGSVNGRSRQSDLPWESSWANWSHRRLESQFDGRLYSRWTRVVPLVKSRECVAV